MKLTTIMASETNRPDINEGAGNFASRAIWGTEGKFERFCSLTVMDGMTPIAVIIMHNYYPEHGTIEISAAGSGRWQSRRIINEVFDTCFKALGCQMIVMRNSAWDGATVNNSRRLGFTGILIPRMRGPGHDEWLFSLTREQWELNPLRKSDVA